MIILQKLEWSNWFSYGENNSIEFNIDTLTQVLGTNGVGKSSIPLILEEVLYGKNSKGIKKADIPNWNLDKPTLSAKLMFSVNSDNYIIDLQRKSSLKLKLIENDKDLSYHTATATYKKIEEILGMDFKTFSQLIYQSSSSNLQFLTATDATRKAFLIGLFNLDRYTEIHNIFKDATKTASAQCNKIRGSLSTTAAWIKKANDMSFEKSDMLNILDDPEHFRAELANKTNELSNIKSLNTKINNNNTYKDMLANLKPTSSVSPEDAQRVSKIVETQEEVSVLTHQLKTARNALSNLETLTATECPTCMQLIDQEIKTSMVKGAEIAINNILDVSAKKNKELTELKEIKRKITKYSKDNREFETIWSKIDQELNEQLYDADELNEEILELKDIIRDKVAEIKKVTEHNKQAEISNHKIDTVLEQLASYENELEKYNKELTKLEDLLSSLEILKKSFSTTGLISYKIEYLVKDLEDTINKYLAELSSGKFLINFSLNGDKLVVGVINEGKEVNINSTSTGQLARVNTATLLAIRKLMSHISKSRINILFLDETLSALDSTGKDGLIDLLLEEKELNTFLVSHDFTHPLLAKIQVEMEDGISRISDG